MADLPVGSLGRRVAAKDVAPGMVLWNEWGWRSEVVAVEPRPAEVRNPWGPVIADAVCADGTFVALFAGSSYRVAS